MSGASDAEALAFIALESTAGLGPRRIRALWERYGSGRIAVAATGQGDFAAARSALARAKRAGLRAIPLGGPEYPHTLYELGDPPPILYVRGAGWPAYDSSVAVVGTRRASAYGLRMGARLGRDLARWGWTVVSGMAAGVDAAAHEGALNAAGRTMGVLGSGHDHEYPASNRALYRRMRSEGWLVSEFDPKTGPFRAAFPRRNRLIAALSRVVVVVEAGEKSGALNTARHALELGRDVLAVPARAADPRGAGVLKLLRDGAGLATEVHDIFDAVGWTHDDPPPPRERTQRGDRAPGGPDSWLLARLANDERTLDELVVSPAHTVGEAVAALGRLEVDGRIARSPDGRFHLVERPPKNETP